MNPSRDNISLYNLIFTKSYFKCLNPTSSVSLVLILLVTSNPEIIKICSVLDIAKNVEEYYTKGYVVGAIHPVLLSSGQRRHFPASHIYRVVLVRLKFR